MRIDGMDPLAVDPLEQEESNATMDLEQYLRRWTHPEVEAASLDVEAATWAMRQLLDDQLD